MQREKVRRVTSVSLSVSFNPFLDIFFSRYYIKADLDNGQFEYDYGEDAPGAEIAVVCEAGYNESLAEGQHIAFRQRVNEN